jgi:hypothetical protein
MDTKKLKPFDLDAAKRGEPLVTRDGRKATFIAHVPEFDAYERVMVRIDGLGCSVSLGEDGKFKPASESCHDLFMAPRKVELWVNVYDSRLSGNPGYRAAAFDTEEAARDNAKRDGLCPIGAVLPITFEV